MLLKFLTFAIGELYQTFSEEEIHALLKVEDIAPDDLALLDRVTRNAKLYFKDPQRFNQIFQEVLGDDDHDISELIDLATIVLK